MRATGTSKDGYRVTIEAPAGKTKKEELIKVAMEYIKQGDIEIFYDEGASWTLKN